MVTSGKQVSAVVAAKENWTVLQETQHLFKQ